MADLTLSTNPPNAGDALTSQDQADIRAGLGLGSAATTAATDYATAAQGAASAAHIASTSNPHATTKAQVGLGNVDNTSDAAKPISTATAAALAGKQDTLVSGTSIKTINGQSVLGSGDLTVSGSGSGANLSYTASPTNGVVASDTGTDATVPLSDGTNAGLMSPAQHTKLAGIATGATANATDAQLRDRTTHTGEQAISTVTGLQTALDGKLATTDPSVTNAREWTAATATQAEAEAGTGTTRLAFTPLRVFQAIAAWWAASAFATKLAGIETGATANSTDAQLRDRSTHTGTQAAGTITGLATVATSGSAADLTGNLAVDRLNSGTGATSSTFWRGDGTWAAPAGGGGSPGGSDTQVQFNDGGAFAGASGWTWNKATNTMTLASGTQTASNPAQVVTQTWNAGGVTFTGWRLNVTDTASAAASLLADWQVGGASRVSISKAGAVSLAASGTKSAPTINFAASAGSGTCGIWTPSAFSVAFGVQGEPAFVIQFSGVRVGSAASIGWSSSQFGADITGADTTLFRDAANVVAQRNGTNAQEHRTYGTFTDASNYRRLSKGMSTSGVAFLRPEGAGTGASGNVLHISGLPTSNPGPGILWNDAGTVKVGT